MASLIMRLSETIVETNWLELKGYHWLFLVDFRYVANIDSIGIYSIR